MAITFEALAGVLSLNVNQWTSGFQKAGTDASRFKAAASQAFNTLSVGARNVGLALGGIGTAMAAAAAITVKEASTFEQTMARLKATVWATLKDTEAVNAAMVKLTNQTSELAKVTQYNPQQIAQGMIALKLAGLDVTQVMGALSPALNLAAASQTDVMQTAAMLGSAINGLGLPVQDITRLVDVLAKASVTSNTDIMELGVAFRYVGSLGHAAGISLETMTAELMSLAQGGRAGMLGGTALRQIFAALYGDSKNSEKVFRELGISIRDVGNVVKPLDVLIDEFNAKSQALGSTFDVVGASLKAFGDRGGPAFADMLLRGGQAIRDFKVSMKDAGDTAATMANIQLATTQSAFTLLKSSVQLLSIEIGNKLNPVLKAAALSLMDWVNANIAAISSGVGEWWKGFVATIKDYGAAFSRAFQIVRPAIDWFRGALISVRDTASNLFDRLPLWAQDVVQVGLALSAIGFGLKSIGGQLPIIGTAFMAFGALINPLGIIGGLFTVLVSAIAAIATPTGAAVVALGLLAAPIALAIANSQELREKLVEVLADIRDGAIALANGALKILAEWWAKNKDEIVRTGELAAKSFADMAEAAKPLAAFLASALGVALKDMLNSLAEILKIGNDLTAWLREDSVSAGNEFQKMLLSLIRLLAKVIEMTPGLGLVFKPMTDQMRAFADEQERILELDAKGRSTKGLMATESDQVAAAKKKEQGLLATDQAEADRQRKIRGDAVVAEQARLDALRAAAGAKATPSVPVIATTAGPLQQPAGLHTISDQASAGGVPATAASGGGASGAGSSAGGAVAGSSAGGSEKEKKTVAPLDEAELVKRYGAKLGNTNREQALAMFGGLHEGVTGALNKDKDTGAIDTTQAMTVVENYRKILSKIPGYSAEAFEAVSIQLIGSLRKLNGVAEPEIQKMLLTGIEQAADQGEKVFQDKAALLAQQAEQWRQKSAAGIAAKIDELAKYGDAVLAEARKAGASTTELAELNNYEMKANEAMQQIGKLHGEERDAAIKDLQDTVAAYEKAYNRIVRKVDESGKAIAAAGGAAAGVAERAAGERAARQARMAGGDAGLAAAPQAGGQGVQGGGPAGAQQPGQAAAVGAAPAGPNLVGASPEARRARMAAQKAADAAQPGLVDQVTNMANEMSSIMTGAVSGAFSAAAPGMEAVAQVMESGSPLQKLSTQITALSAHLSMLRLNAQFGANPDDIRTMQTQLGGLERRRSLMLEAERKGRTMADKDRQANYQRMKQEELNQARDERRETGYDLAGAVAVSGLRSPTIININGIHDIRTAVDHLELELKRRGWNRGTKRTLEARFQ